jgi:prepilin-type N-terminal cleavage/methylation domain-containing protein
MREKKMRTKRRGFSLVEILIVAGVLSILAVVFTG